MDKVSSEIRSKNMSAIRSKNTKPELLVRKSLYGLGYRYRIHYKLIGKPDIVFVTKKLAVFINGCFWHGHNCPISHTPKSNTEFWNTKIKRNIERDTESIKKLESNGWEVVTVWECEIKNNLNYSVSKITTRLEN